MLTFEWFYNLFRKSTTKPMMAVAPPSTVSAAPSKIFNYLLNDPTTPELMIQVPLPAKPQGPDFTVRGLDQNCECTGCLCQRAAGCQITVCKAIEYTQQLLKKAIPNWSSTKVLFVDPEAGIQFNAFYDRESLRFFYDTDPLTQKVVYCAEGTDTVAHELFHAIIDALRPDLWDLHALEIWAFHEGGADCGAMMHLMLHDAILEHALKETDGNLRKSNVISRVAVELGNALYHVTKGEDGSVGGYLRDATNVFNYVKPETLPVKAKVSELASEPHSFSRVWSGAWYDAMINIYEQEVAAGAERKIALITARDIIGGYLLEGIRMAPASPRFFSAVAHAMIMASRADGGKYTKAIRKAFQDRQIIPIEVPLLAPHDHRLTVDSVLQGIEHGHEIVRNHVLTAIRTKVTHTVSPEKPHGMAAAINPLFGLKIDVPADEYFEFNLAGNLVKHIGVVKEDISQAVHGCLYLLHHLGCVSDDPNTPFEVKDGKLVRSHFACGSGGIINNSTIPGSPEYGKPWKPENNCGCGWCGKPKASGETQQIKRGCVVRYQTCRNTTLRTGQNTNLRTC